MALLLATGSNRIVVNVTRPSVVMPDPSVAGEHWLPKRGTVLSWKPGDSDHDTRAKVLGSRIKNKLQAVEQGHIRMATGLGGEDGVAHTSTIQGLRTAIVAKRPEVSSFIKDALDKGGTVRVDADRPRDKSAMVASGTGGRRTSFNITNHVEHGQFWRGME